MHHDRMKVKLEKPTHQVALVFRRNQIAPHDKSGRLRPRFVPKESFRHLRHISIFPRGRGRKTCKPSHGDSILVPERAESPQSLREGTYRASRRRPVSRDGRDGYQATMPNRDVLLLVDVLDDFDHEDGTRLLESFAERHPALVKVLDHARRSDTPIVFANDSRGQWDSHVAPRLIERALNGPGGALVRDIAPRRASVSWSNRATPRLITRRST